MNQMELEIANNAFEMIIVFDETGNILFSNRAANFELGYEEGLKNVNLRTIMRQQFPQDRNFSVEAIRGIIETVLYRKNNTCFPVRIKIATFTEMSGRYQLMALNNTKDQELKKRLFSVKQEAEDALKVRNQFVANVTHELRTPLNGIRGHMTNLQDTELTEEQRRTSKIILQCCDNMAVIINNILDFEKLKEGRFRIEKKEFRFREMLNRVIDKNINIIHEKGLQLSVNVAEDISDRLVGDDVRIEQVLDHILSNAVKFTSIGYISLEVSKTWELDEEVELFFRIRDTGIGISGEDQDKLFHSFSQVDGSITRRYGGTGLGLIISKRLVELMGGNINVESEKGKGSTFSFSVRVGVAATSETEDTDVGKDRKTCGSFVAFHPFDTDISKYKDIGKCFIFGTPENLAEIHKKLEKMIVCLELGSWERAEGFAEDLKLLLKNQEGLKKSVFRLEMCIRKEDYEKSMQRYQIFKDMLENEIRNS